MAIKGDDYKKMSVGSSKGHKNMVVWQSIDELDMKEAYDSNFPIHGAFWY